MRRVASDSVLKGIAIEEAVNEKNLSARGLFKYGVIGVVFKDDFSYHLRFQSHSVISPVDAFEHIDTCYNVSSPYCKIPLYWYEGFLSIQSSIDAAVIEMKTNRSVWEEMKSISGIRLQSPLIKSIYKLDYIWFTIYSMLCFSPYMYFLSVKVIREKKKLKVLMRAMGLQDIAFWLSWSLLYTIYIAITSNLPTLWALLPFFVIVVGLFLLNHYSLLKQPHITSFVGFFLHIVFGSLGFMTLFEQVPPSLEWVFNLFSPYTFTAGISKIVKLEKYGPTVAAELYPFFNLYGMLILDSILYLLLAIYFDKVLPGKYGVPYPPLFFLRPSYWLQQGSKCSIQPDSIPVPGCDTEPMPEGFEGKEAIRLYNIRKMYERKGKRTEALRGLSFNIYEGQITALLGLSGSGKTALLNVLSGFSKPSAGSAVIYNYKVSEVQDMEGIQALVGICPQLNLHFEALTVKENLRIFAHIKGIQWKEVEQEVQKVLVQLDLTDLQDVHADSLSWGQKRKLSLAIAILGDPQVLLLDEPMVGLDPCSRHHVWELLAERRAGRVTLICTQSVEEADACADWKAFLSNGRLQCVGSSLYLKRKWGIGYHLRMCINDQCDPGLASSLVRRYIPNAVLKGRDRDELCYMLPLENTKSFPDLLGHLDNGLLLGVVHYEVSRTTLADALLKLEGKEDADHKGKALIPLCKIKRLHFVFSSKNMCKFLLDVMFHRSWQVKIILFVRSQDHGNLWRKVLMQVISAFLPRSLFSSIALLAVPLVHSHVSNKTDCTFHCFTPKLSRLMQHRHYTLMCGAEPINCFPVLINTLSNTFLRLFNSTAQIRIWSHPFYRVTFPEGLCGDPIPACRIQRSRALPPQNNDPPGQEPPEVQAERERARSAASSLQPEVIVVVNGLRKEYEDKRACSIFKKRKKVAIKNLSFCVKKGEVLGLLGPSGAGKSTTIRMISGDVAVTAGEVGGSFGGCRAVVLGCCPQEDPLWPDLTVLQHLEAYAAVRGVRGEDAAVLISRVAKALDLQKCLKTPARRLSAGEARKLCFALSILGSPTVMLWDEPSAGMDVAGQRCLWKAIQAAVRSKECAAVLSTHCLEEAAMCDRVAVLVAGQLRYIGSPEELRRKFGTSYILEVKPKDVGQSDALHSEILHLFPGAARQKRISSLLTYKIPVEDVLPLSQAFSKLEAAKQNFRLEEYSLSLHTLQQVCWFRTEMSGMFLKKIIITEVSSSFES
uniref:ABC transporter domain-containing protein n=1 Tax=Chrysolophus pictus TaxID=9089 RepID=A0A8C3LBS3_CHRPC